MVELRTMGSDVESKRWWSWSVVIASSSRGGRQRRRARAAAAGWRCRIEEVVLDYDERALSSTTPQLPDPRVVARAVYDAVAESGPLQRHVADPEVEEIWINGRLPHGSRQ